MRAVYLDYNGSAPIDPRVVEIMMAAIADGTGNASATHRFARRQAAAVDEAREHVATMVGGRPGGVCSRPARPRPTTWRCKASWTRRRPDRPRILISAVEHVSVSRTASLLAAKGLTAVDVAPVTAGGFVDPPGAGRVARHRRSFLGFTMWAALRGACRIRPTCASRVPLKRLPCCSRTITTTIAYGYRNT